MSSATAAAAAALSSGGHGKSGKPWARLTAPAATASRFISRMTDSLKRSALAEILGRAMARSLSPGSGRRPGVAGARMEPGHATMPPWRISVWHDEVTRPDGAAGIYGVVHFANIAAGVLAIDDDDRVLLVGQHRYTL